MRAFMRERASAHTYAHTPTIAIDENATHVAPLDSPPSAGQSEKKRYERTK